MFMQWPDVIRTSPSSPQLTVDSPVSHVDLFTSFASLVYTSKEARTAALSKGLPLDGLNVFDFVHAAMNKRQQEEHPSSAHRNNTVVDALRAQQALTELHSQTRTLFWRSGRYIAVRVGDWKLQLSEHPDKVWFHHLRSDPHEWRNLALEVNVTTQGSLQDLLTRLPSSDAKMTRALERLSVDAFEFTNDFVAHQLRRIYLKLSETDQQQKPPLWPATAETPVLIDKDVTQKQNADDEYIYWSN